MMPEKAAMTVLNQEMNFQIFRCLTLFPKIRGIILIYPENCICREQKYSVFPELCFFSGCGVVDLFRLYEKSVIYQ